MKHHYEHVIGTTLPSRGRIFFSAELDEPWKIWHNIFLFQSTESVYYLLHVRLIQKKNRKAIYQINKFIYIEFFFGLMVHWHFGDTIYQSNICLNDL